MYTALLMIALLELVPSKPVTCPIGPLPPSEERTDTFWVNYLESSLAPCFGWAGEVETKGIRVFIAEGPFGGSDPKNRLIAVGRDFLKTVQTPEEALFIFGHEVAHVVVDRAFRHRLFVFYSTREMEITADLFAAESIPLGACVGARVLESEINRKEFDEEQYAPMRQFNEERHRVLIGYCGFKALTVGRELPRR